MKAINIAIIAVIVLSFAVAFYFYPKMPDVMASHWGIDGNANDYMNKTMGVFLMPMISLAILILFTVMPMIDPMKENIAQFRDYFDRFIFAILVFLFYLYCLTIAWNLGYRFDMLQMLAPAFGIIFYYMGILTEKARMNWFIGIRTPWTMSSQRVWEKTHRLGGKMFKVSGALAFFGVFFKEYLLLFILAPVLLVSLYLIVYSYLEYKKEQKPGKPVGMKMMMKKTSKKKK